MNNFDGIIDLYPEICIDNFVSSVIYNINIKCYILSHFHDDHMKNLEDYEFYRLLSDSGDRVKFLVSPITKRFIETCDKYQHLAEHCKEVACESPILVKLSSTESVTVTFCGSGHCPGSVMIFIEGARGNVLFTGDFRLPLNCAGRLFFLREHHMMSSADSMTSSSSFDLSTNSSASSKAIKAAAAAAAAPKPSSQESNKIKTVQDIYVDMTFFKTEITHIPSREESVDALIAFIQSFLGLGENYYHKPAKDESVCFKNCVYLKTSARIGYEYVYREIYNRLGFKIHVNQLIYKIYDKLGEIQKVLTLNPYETPIHSCIYENRKRDLAKTDLMSSSLNSSKASAKPCAYSGSSCYGDGIKFPNEFNLDLPCEPCAGGNKAGVKVNAAKVILSAMWFTDTAGVDRIFLEYKPHKSEMDSIAYKPYSKIYRLCFSFHSSFEELVNFINIIKPKKRIYSIALPESTTEQQINDCFYDASGQFVPFQLSRLTRQSSLDSNKVSKLTSPSSSQSSLSSSQLVLRKRNSVSDIINNKKTGDHDSSFSSNGLSSSDSEGGLNFGSSDEEGPKKRRLN